MNDNEEFIIKRHHLQFKTEQDYVDDFCEKYKGELEVEKYRWSKKYNTLDDLDAYISEFHPDYNSFCEYLWQRFEDMVVNVKPYYMKNWIIKFEDGMICPFIISKNREFSTNSIDKISSDPALMLSILLDKPYGGEM